MVVLVVNHPVLYAVDCYYCFPLDPSSNSEHLSVAPYTMELHYSEDSEMAFSEHSNSGLVVVVVSSVLWLSVVVSAVFL